MKAVHGSRRVRLGRVAEFYPYTSKRLLNVTKRLAINLVADALRTGALTKRPCAVCGRRRAEAHHDDYARPLDIQWLCRFHHRKRDAFLREQRRLFVRAQADAQLPTFSPLRRQELAPSRPELKRPLRRSLMCCDSTIELVTQATSTLADVMAAECVSESVIARRMSVSRQVVNAQFAGGFRTLKLVSAYADALGYEASIVLVKRQAHEAVAS